MHANGDEMLFVIDGLVRFRLGDELHAGEAGAFAAEVEMTVVGPPLARSHPL